MFLEALNATVLGELKSFREQHDAMWMESVREMGAQRLEAQREIKSLTSSLLEVKKDIYWQQRIAVLQFTILILGLGYVIFSRVPSGPQPYFGDTYTDLPDRAKTMNGQFKHHDAAAAYETPPASPSTAGPSPRFSWLRRASPQPENFQQGRLGLTREKSLPALPDSGLLSSSPSPSPGLSSSPLSSDSSMSSKGVQKQLQVEDRLAPHIRTGGYQTPANWPLMDSRTSADVGDNGNIARYANVMELGENEELLRPQSGPI